MRHARSCSAILVILATVALAWPNGARACKCQELEPSPLVRPNWPESSGLVLVSERLELDCAVPDRCHWHSIQVYQRVGTGEPARVPVRLPFIESWSLKVTWGGRPVDVIHDYGEERDAALAAIDSQLAEPSESREGAFLWLEDAGTATSIVLEIEGDVSVDLDYTHVGPHTPRCCHLNALQVRHPWVPTYTTTATWSWTDPDANAVGPNSRTHVEVRAEPSLTVEVDGQPADPELDAASRDGVRFSLTDHGRLKGGPFVALGGAILDANPARGRIGWEHAEPLPYLFYSAALETDFVSEFSLVPAIELTHGHGRVFAFLPCAGLGFGVPIQVVPVVRPAIRAQASLSWRMVSFVTTFDWLMAMAPSQAGIERPTMYRLAFLGQLSF